MRFSNSKISLLGMSEGAIIASLVAERKEVPVDALFLLGTPPENGYESAIWQLRKDPSWTAILSWFDSNRDGKIQKHEYVYAPDSLGAKLGNFPFDSLDINKDSVLMENDFAINPRLTEVLSAIERHDDEWIWQNYFRVGSMWFYDHRQLGSNTERILNLDLPVFIFHGAQDKNCPVEGMTYLLALAKTNNKDNIHVNIFEGHEHSLNFFTWITDHKPSTGWQSIINQVQNQK